jgi:hypothetical protein
MNSRYCPKTKVKLAETSLVAVTKPGAISNKMAVYIPRSKLRTNYQVYQKPYVPV